MNDNVTDFVRRLVSLSPDLVHVYRQHMVEQGSLLPHVLMGDITRVVIVSADDKQVNWLPKFLKQLEIGLASGDEDIVELIGVSFVENLSGENSAIRSLLPSMGEALRKEVKSILGV